MEETISRLETLEKLTKVIFLMVWSYSRRDLLERCLRAYYYQYYGANKRTAKSEPQKEVLHFLKSLKNRYLRTGDILHSVIRAYLKAKQRGEAWSVDRVLSWAQKIYGDDYAYSRQYQPGDPPAEGPHPPSLQLPLVLKRTDEELTKRVNQEIRRYK